MLATTIFAAAGATFFTAIAGACLWVGLSGARRRDWRFMAGAFVIGAIFGLQAVAFWDVAITGHKPSLDDDAPRLR